ncbi:type II toxin-antitoxin system VapB family antitoxin [bacterium]
MRTNIVIDDDLLKQAFRITKLQTKRQLIDMALKEFVRNHTVKDLRDLKGKIKFRL